MNEISEKNAGEETSWRWCLVGNIVGAHEFGEDKEIRYGTKHFSPGTKVFLYPELPGMGNEYILAIGIPRNGGHYIEVVIRTKYAENFRCQKVYKPSVLKRMDNSKYLCWWGNSEEDRTEITGLAEVFNKEAAELCSSKKAEGEAVSHTNTGSRSSMEIKKACENKASILHEIKRRLRIIRTALSRAADDIRHISREKQ